VNETTRTDKDALGQFLVQRLSEEDPTGAPLTVAELRRQLLPYPVCREELDFATKAEYDQAVLKLLSDETWLVIEDEALQEALEKERASPEPGLAFLGDFSPSFLHPGPRLTGDELEDDLEFLEQRGADGTSVAVPEDEEAADDAEDEASAEATPEANAEETLPEAGAEETPEASADATPAATSNPSGAGGGECWSCSAELPVRSDLQYCPFCGCDQTAPECLNCQAELEMAWSYCPACGTATGRP
jgi:hypothetical protein